MSTETIIDTVSGGATAEGWKDIHREMLARPSLNGKRHKPAREGDSGLIGDGGTEV